MNPASSSNKRNLQSHNNFNSYETEPEKNQSELDWLSALWDTSLEKNETLGYNSGAFRPNSLADYYLNKSYPKFVYEDFETLEVPQDFKPHIIVGLARCGTTMVTACLGRHPNIYPINECRTMLAEFLPLTDLYSSHPPSGAKILDSHEVDPEGAKKMRQAFYKIQTALEDKFKLKGTLVIKDVDFSTFVNVADASFEGSKYFEIARQPKSAVRSMATYKLGWDREESGFFGSSGIAIQAAIEYIQQHPKIRSALELTENLAGIDEDNYESCYLWYALGAQIMIDWVAQNGTDRYLKMAYEDFIAKPREAFTKLLEFLELEITDDFLQEVESLANHTGVGVENERKSRLFSEETLRKLYSTNLTRVQQRRPLIVCGRSKEALEDQK